MICKNCSKEFIGRFCNHCGQKKIENRLNFKDVISDFAAAFNFESGLPLTIQELFTTPNILIKNFLDGKRKIYFSPIKYLLVFMTINLFMNNLFYDNDDPFSDFIKNPLFSIFIFLIFIPTLSVFSKWLSKKYTFTEHIVINLYFLGTSYIIITIVGSIRIITTHFNFDFLNFPLVLLVQLIPIIYLVWYYKKIYKKNIFKTMIIAFAAYITSYIIFVKVGQLIISLIN